MRLEYVCNIFMLFFVSIQNCTNSLRLVQPCRMNEFQCNDRLTCIHKTWLCDGGPDCPNGEDEHLSICQNITCREDQFQCKDLSCIPGHLMCSGKAECLDGSDEFNCSKYIRAAEQN